MGGNPQGDPLLDMSKMQGTQVGGATTSQWVEPPYDVITGGGVTISPGLEAQHVTYTTAVSPESSSAGTPAS